MDLAGGRRPTPARPKGILPPIRRESC